MKTVIAIGGPTASGKTALSIRLAGIYNTEIISCDSRQFYKEMSIGTAVPTAEELSLVPHHFIQSHSIATHLSAGAFANEAMPVLNDILERKQVAIVCGGSGLYMQALLNGMDDFPVVKEGIREQLKNDVAEKGDQFLLDELQLADPEYFQIVDQHNMRRVIRALEVFRSSGIPYSSFLKKKNIESLYTVIGIILTQERNQLYKTINERVDSMLASGLEEEARRMFPYRHHPALKTVGYRELFDYFDGFTSLDEATALIKQHTRNYAKRQLTWFKNRHEFKTFFRSESEQIQSYINSCMISDN